MLTFVDQDLVQQLGRVHEICRPTEQADAQQACALGVHAPNQAEPIFAQLTHMSKQGTARKRWN
jgi:hypothetical protein